MSTTTATRARKAYSLTETAEILGESVDTVGRLCRTGLLRGAYKGGVGAKNSPWRIPPAAIDRYQTTQPRN